MANPNLLDKNPDEMTEAELREYITLLGDKDADVEGAKDDDNFKIGQFEALLNRLEGSKKRQQRQRSVEGRRDIFAQGLAGMMGNF